MEVVVNAKAKGNVRAHLDKVAVAAVAESLTTTEGNIHEATTIVRRTTSAKAIREVKARVRQPAAVAAAIVLLRKRAGHRFLNVPINWNN